MNRIKILDSMRGMAASIVVFHHVFTRFPYLYQGQESTAFIRILRFISELNVEAVLFFFILSGFSIRLSLRKGLPLTKEILNEYLYRRFKRILPLYYFAIFFTLLSGFLTHTVSSNEDFNLKNLLGNLLFLQSSKSYKGNWFAPYGDNGPLWSLSFEMFYYLLFPVFMFLMLKLFRISRFSEKTNCFLLASTFLLSLVCTMINTRIFFPYIAFGALFYVWYCGFFLADLHSGGKVALDLNFVVCVSLMILSGLLLHLKYSATLYKLFAGATMTASFFVIYLVRTKYRVLFQKYLERAFNFFFTAIGKGSYALYLLHYPVLMIIKHYYQVNLLQMIFLMGLVCLFSIWIELNFVKMKLLVLKVRYIR